MNPVPNLVSDGGDQLIKKYPLLSGPYKKEGGEVLSVSAWDIKICCLQVYKLMLEYLLGFVCTG